MMAMIEVVELIDYSITGLYSGFTAVMGSHKTVFVVYHCTYFRIFTWLYCSGGFSQDRPCGLSLYFIHAILCGRMFT